MGLVVHRGVSVKEMNLGIKPALMDIVHLTLHVQLQHSLQETDVSTYLAQVTISACQGSAMMTYVRVQSPTTRLSSPSFS